MTPRSLAHWGALAGFLLTLGVVAPSLVEAMDVRGLSATPYLIQASDCGALLLVDETAGGSGLTLSPSVTLPVGCTVEVFKADRTSNPVNVSTTAGDRLNEFYTVMSCARITQDSCRIVNVGDGRFLVLGQSFRTACPKSHRTVTVTDAGGGVAVDPLDIRTGCELYRVATDQRTVNGVLSPGPIALYLPPLSQITGGGGYLGGVIDVTRVGAFGVWVFAFQGETIEGAPYIVLTEPWQHLRLYGAADMWWVE